MKKETKFTILAILLSIAVSIAACAIVINNKNNESKNQEAEEEIDTNYNYYDFCNDVEQEKIEKAIIKQTSSSGSGIIHIYLKDDNDDKTEENNDEKVIHVKALSALNASEIEHILRENKVEYSIAANTTTTSDAGSAAGILIIIGLFTFLLVLMSKKMNVQNGGLQGKVPKKKIEKVDAAKNTVSFKNVAGLTEEKADLEEIVDFLKNPEKYTSAGARIPKGVILAGPPGTGKTLLAKAISGEAGVPFYSLSGSEFVEVYVGVGASRVRDLFQEAKKNAPCIVFIDEIDAVAKSRIASNMGGNDEREQTLNQLLVEMDGFGKNEGIIVIAATNRIDTLDPAILRPGRFDRKIMVNRPDAKGREEIMKVHSVDKKLAEDVDLAELSHTTSGFTGADIENLMNEAAILAAKSNTDVINKEMLSNAFTKIAVGPEKKSKVISERDKTITAYHESGHAVLFHLLPNMEEVHSISIIPTGYGAGGYTMALPTGDDMFVTKAQMHDKIISLLGGRIAEELMIKDVTTGASQDLKEATRITREMILKYGMSDAMGLVCYEDDGGRIGAYGGSMQKNYGIETEKEIDIEVKKVISRCYKEARSILEKNVDVLEKSKNLLIKEEKISGKQFLELFD